ncbi:RRP1 family protein [Abortiporus biennis]
MAETDSPPLGKYLASSDKKTRDKAVKSLAAFLSDPSRDELPKLEMAKLWKGIFYCFWMSDKPLVQQALATELAEILLSISNLSVSLAFLRGFWEAIVREWGGIDRLRMDKYYMLVRRFVNATFRLLMRNNWKSSACKDYISIISHRGGPLCPDDARLPPSLIYHIADIYLEELDKALGNPPTESPLPAPLTALLSPFFTLAARTTNNITFQRIQSSVLDPLFVAFGSPDEDEEDEDEPRSRKRPRLSVVTYDNLVSNSCSTDPKREGALETGQLRKILLRRMFDIASEQDSRDSNRRKLYAIWKSNWDDEEEGDDDDSKVVDAT